MVQQIEIREHGIQLWPGYSTSIKQHERDLLMMAEIKHKLMRSETVLQILQRCFHDNRNNYQHDFKTLILGTIVYTKYNNKTYRVTDVLFDANPTNTFETRDGPISYMDYYKKVRIIADFHFVFYIFIQNL